MFSPAECHENCLALNEFIKVNESEYHPGEFFVDCDMCGSGVTGKQNLDMAKYRALAHLMEHIGAEMTNISGMHIN